LLDARVDWRSFGKFWLPVIAWMALIFLISTDLGSSRQTSRFIGPFLRFFWPAVSEQRIGQVQLAVRKTGHMAGYAALAILALRAKQKGLFPNNWRREAFFFAWTLATLYAISDELHQSFVPTRMASAGDVLIDSIGAALGLGLIWLIGRRRHLW
jgi:VanZ family protein